MHARGQHRFTRPRCCIHALRSAISRTRLPRVRTTRLIPSRRIRQEHLPIRLANKDFGQRYRVLVPIAVYTAGE